MDSLPIEDDSPQPRPAPLVAAARCTCTLRSREPTPFDAETAKFFGESRGALVFHHKDYLKYELPQIHQAVASCFADWELAGEGGSREARPGQVWAPDTVRMTVAPRASADFPIEATMFYRLPSGSRRVLAFEDFGHPDFFRFFLIGPRCEQGELKAELDALAERMKRPHYLQYQVINPNGAILERFEPRSWADIALDAEFRAAVERNTTDIFRRRETFRRNGLPLKRGIILHGPPGTGKTLIGKILAGLRIATFLYITAGDVNEPEAVRAMFELARKLTPTIVFMEDIDLYADKRSGHGSDAVLGEILGQLDGFESNDGVIFIATTNDLEAVEPALSERPSRFDAVLHAGCPSETARRAILSANLPAGAIETRLLDEAAAATDGLSGAHVREAAFLAICNAVLRDACDATGLAQPAAEDFAFAVRQVAGKRDTMVGFQIG